MKQIGKYHCWKVLRTVHFENGGQTNLLDCGHTKLIYIRALEGN